MSSESAKVIVWENASLKVEIDPRDLATHVTTKSTGETIRMAGGQPDDVLINTPGGGVWKSFGGAVASVRRTSSIGVQALLPSLGLAVAVRLEDDDVVFEVAPFGIDARIKARDVLYPRHFLLPRRRAPMRRSRLARAASSRPSSIRSSTTAKGTPRQSPSGWAATPAIPATAASPRPRTTCTRPSTTGPTSPRASSSTGSGRSGSLRYARRGPVSFRARVWTT